MAPILEGAAFMLVPRFSQDDRGKIRRDHNHGDPDDAWRGLGQSTCLERLLYCLILIHNGLAFSPEIENAHSSCIFSKEGLAIFNSLSIFNLRQILVTSREMRTGDFRQFFVLARSLLFHRSVEKEQACENDKSKLESSWRHRHL